MASDGWRAQGPRAKSSRLRTVPSKSLRPEDSVTKSTFNVINQKTKTGDVLNKKTLKSLIMFAGNNIRR